MLERHRVRRIAHPGPEPAGERDHELGAIGPSRQGRQMAGVDLARGAVGEAPHRADDAVAPEGGTQAVEGRDRQHLGHLAAGELALEPVLLLEHPHRPVGQAVHGAAGDMGREMALGRELGALVVGEVEGRGAVGHGQEAQGRGLAGAGEGHHAQRAAGVGTPGCDDGGLLRAGLQGALQGSCAAGRRIERSGPAAREKRLSTGRAAPAATISSNPGADSSRQRIA